MATLTSLCCLFTLAVMTHYMCHVTAYLQCTENDESVRLWINFTNNLNYAVNLTIPEDNYFGHDLTSTCPELSSGRSQQGRSLCPWTYQISYDYNRYPIAMHYARCNCGRCPPPGAIHYYQQHVCKPLYHIYTVVRKRCNANNKIEYYMTSETLPVACICSHLAYDVASG
ncbi:uncharacterized protein LOC131951024 [Physella acuta]|uniref:uncharacterized protein LOC131951024 n=1 Tax=Physella acuta TaxID=109671 RepID=UPI0027DCCCF7|nr:uncharacterized protein LOC131951024 [Physella acuta]